MFWGCDLLGTLHGGEGSLKLSIWTSLTRSVLTACLPGPVIQADLPV